mmetsp:Transcript_31954/g.101734  ORF Transcript_31954/g.101734 Transcript_31954/m.101734 type:complete len:274 (+) Transcript_31954:510-1331(+)
MSWILAWLEYQAAAGLSVAYLYSHQRTFEHRELGVIRSAARRLNLEIVWIEIGLVTYMRLSWNGALKEAQYDCLLRGKADGVAYLLYTSFDDYLTLADGVETPAGEATLDSVVRLAGAGSAQAVTLGGWSWDAQRCHTKRDASAHRAAAAALARHEDEGNLAAVGSTTAALLQGGAFPPACAHAFCDRSAGDLDPRTCPGEAGRRRYLVRPHAVAGLEAHAAVLKEQWRSVDLSTDVAFLRRFRGALARPPSDFCGAGAGAATPPSSTGHTCD